MRTALCSLGLAGLALAVGTLDLDITLAAERERMVFVKLSGRDPVRDLASCARLAHLPPPAPCKSGPCGWVVNTFSVGFSAADAYPHWRSVCAIPVQTKEPAR